MRSSNPVFQRLDGFQEAPAGQRPVHTGDSGPMTVDSVVQKTGVTFAVLLVAAMATWALTGGGVGEVDAARLNMALIIGSGGAFALSLVNSFKQVVSPALVLAFAALEGVALGALSKFFDVQFGDGIVTGAMLGTLAAFIGTLVAYKVLNIKVGDKFRFFVVAGMFGMVGLSLIALVLSLFGISTPLFGFGAIGLLMAIVGLVLGVFMLILDFDFVEHGIAAGLPESESWRAAFALTVSLVWIYTNLLRILAIFSQD